MIKHIQNILDKNSFTRYNPETKSGYITGQGTISGKKVYISANDSNSLPDNVFDGFQQQLNLLEEVKTIPAPLILLIGQPAHHQSTNKSPMPQNPEKILIHKKGIGNWYYMHGKLSGKVPQIAVVYDKLGAALTFPVEMCDTAIMHKDAGMSIGRPDVVKKMLGLDVEYAKLGGPMMHLANSGSIDFIAENDNKIAKYLREYLHFFQQQSGLELPTSLPREKDQSKLAQLVPNNSETAFDMQAVIKRICDTGFFLELRKDFAKEIITALVKINGNIAGVLANNSIHKGGLLFPDSCRKATRFISLCDAFGIPLVFLSDSSGFMVGPEVEQKGIIKTAANLFSTIANTSVPRLTVIIRRAYTAGLYAMAGGGMNPDKFYALPTADMAIYGKNVASKIMQDNENKNDIQNMQKMAEYATNINKLQKAGLIEQVVEPENLESRNQSFH